VEIHALLADKDMADRILTVGPIAEPLASPEQVAAFLQVEHQRWSAAAKEIGLLPE
tara:strand:+ start:269 stop:436 length:168 start_codon:yes stop_codon:yes gene_type:complete